jgi:FlaA1/EpsC-like NDP-sugar epimerase
MFNKDSLKLMGQRHPTILLQSLDFLLAGGSFCLAYLLRFQLDMAAATLNGGPLAPRAIFFSMWIMLGLSAMGMYRARQRPRVWETVARVIIATVIGVFFCFLFFYLLPELSAGRSVLIRAMVITSVVLCISRLMLLSAITVHDS